MNFAAIDVQIQRYVDDHFPGWVECGFIDAEGHEHIFVEKAPVISAENLFPDSVYPRQGFINCEVEKTWVDDAGRLLALVNTKGPWSIESTAGATQFVVLASQIKE